MMNKPDAAIADSLPQYSADRLKESGPAATPRVGSPLCEGQSGRPVKKVNSCHAQTSSARLKLQ